MTYQLKKILQTDKSMNFLSGYYDARIFSKCGKYVVLTEVKNCFEYPNLKNPAKIWLSNLFTNEKKIIGLSETCNFQQGSKAQFIYIEEETFIIYNRYSIEKNYYSEAVHITNGNKIEFDFPIYSISQDSKLIASVDFRKLDITKRSYSYGFFTHEKALNNLRDQQIKIFETKTKKLLNTINLKELKTYKKGINKQHIDHVVFSPSAKKVAFYHCIKNKKGVHLFFYSYDLNNDKLNYFNIPRNTHFNWIDDTRIIIWGSKGNFFTKIKNILPSFFLKTLLDYYKKFVKGNSQVGNNMISKTVTGDRYLILDINKNKLKNFASNKNINEGDGHPTYLDNLEILITDTYPNQKNIISLKIFDVKANSILAIKQFSHNDKAKNSGYRADLHPKVCSDNRLIAVDTFEKSTRSVKIYKLIKK